MRKQIYSRRRFVGSLAGVGAAACAGGGWSRAVAAAVGPRDADLVVFNAKVYTVEASQPEAEAFAVRNGRFIAVGANDAVKALIGKGTQTFDARQMTIVPGFIDCHNHADGETLLYDVLVGNPFEVEFVTIDSIVDKLSARAKVTPPGYWVDGYFYDDTKVKDKRPITIHDLDRVS